MVNGSEALQTVEGPVKYGLTNDYMFRAVFQESNKALRHLLAALLDIEYEEITSCEIMNPIVLGEQIEDKSCVLDIKVKLNNEKLINLEMQMGHFAYWAERALFYLSRVYCNIRSGEDYEEIMPAIHVGILEKSPFPGRKKFYSQYLMTCTEDQHVFSGKFAIRMLCLNQLENVPEEMKGSELYHWARLFKATSWEEIKMLIDGKEYLEEAASHLRKLTEEEKVQMQCEMREKYRRDMSCIRKEGIREGRTQMQNEMREKYERDMSCIRKEGIREGRTQMQNEMREKHEKDMDRIFALLQKLNADNRTDDITKVATNAEYRERLMKEYDL